MPVIQGRRYENYKCYRPNGTRYSAGEAPVVLTDQNRGYPYAVRSAMYNSIKLFKEEFGEEPVWDNVVFEIVCATVNVRATLLEIKDGE